MNRRAFLSLLAGGAAAAAVAPAVPLGRVWSFPSLLARLLPWRRTDAGLIVPVTEFVPTTGNLFLATDWISMETLRILKNNLTVDQYFSTDWEKDFAGRFKLGSEIKIPIRFPQRFVGAHDDDDFAGIDDVNEYG